MLKNRIIFAVLFILALNSIYSFGGPAPYTFFYLMVMMPLISFIYAFIVYRSLSCHQYISTLKATKGDIVKFEYVFNNSSILMNPFVRCEFCDTTMLAGELGGNSGFSVEPLSLKKKMFTIQCKYRGLYDIGIKKVYVEDFLGIFRFNLTLNERFQLKVYPRIQEIDDFQLYSNVMEDSDTTKSLLSEQMNDISEIKKYNYGDPLRKIHWKLTAKLNEIMVKNTESTARHTSDILINLSPVEMTGEDVLAAEDRMTELFCSLSYYLTKKRYPVKIHQFSGILNKMEFDNFEGFNKFYDAVPEIKFDSGIQPDSLLNLFLKNNFTGSNFFLFTHVINPDVAEKLIRAGNMGWKVTLVYLVLDGEKYKKDEEIMRNLSFNNIRILEFSMDSDIRSIFEGCRQVVL